MSAPLDDLIAVLLQVEFITSLAIHAVVLPVNVVATLVSAVELLEIVIMPRNIAAVTELPKTGKATDNDNMARSANVIKILFFINCLLQLWYFRSDSPFLFTY